VVLHLLFQEAPLPLHGQALELHPFQLALLLIPLPVPVLRPCLLALLLIPVPVPVLHPCLLALQH
jgi:hypothetical protein